VYSVGDAEYRKQKVFQCVIANPGISKEGVVRGMKGDPSRITILNILDELKEDDLIVLRKDKPNSQIYRIYPNNKNALVSVSRELNDFEQAYVAFLKKSNERIVAKLESNYVYEIGKNLGLKEPFEWKEPHFHLWSKFAIKKLNEVSKRIEKRYFTVEKLYETFRRYDVKKESDSISESVRVPIRYYECVRELREQFLILKKTLEDTYHFEIIILRTVPLWIFKTMLSIYLYRCTFIWTKKIQDKDTLTKLYVLLYKTIARIQLHISEIDLFRGSQRYSDRYVDFLSSSHLLPQIIFVSPIYVAFDMKKEINAVANSLCQISDELGEK
jgi:hypothetical protein